MEIQLTNQLEISNVHELIMSVNTPPQVGSDDFTANLCKMAECLMPVRALVRMSAS